MNSKKRKGTRNDVVVNTAPDADSPADETGAGGDIPRPPRTMTRGGADPFKQSRAGMGRMWSNYRQTLVTSFQKMSRYEQESLIQRMCLIVTVGVTGLALLLFYALLNRTVRVFLVPGAIFGAWWAANRIVTPVVCARLEGILNKE